MGHPIADCDTARDLMRAVWRISPIIRIDTLEMGWYEKAKRIETELHKRPDYREAMADYKRHLKECETCIATLEGLNHEAEEMQAMPGR